jgi:hypothetical protein
VLVNLVDERDVFVGWDFGVDRRGDAAEVL